MPARRVKRHPFACGHKGRGKFCHRCEQGAHLKALADECVTNIKSIPEKMQKRAEDGKRIPFTPDDQKRIVAQMRTESERLYAVAKKAA